MRAPGFSSAGRARVSFFAEVCLGSLALVCASILLVEIGSARVSARSADEIESRAAESHNSSSGEATRSTTSKNDKHTGSDAVIGRLEIPRIDLQVPILENYDPASLRLGVGRISGTAWIGGLGNLALAGHRDTFFYPLRNIRSGMEINIVTTEGTFRYVVDSTEVVTPDQVNVLDIRNRPELTLVTCYPFKFIGAAPKRFIVHAHLLSLNPD